MPFSRKVSSVTCFIALGLLPVINISAHQANAGDAWLSQGEQEFFEALGVDARVNGTTIKRPANLGAWSEIAQRAPQPLKGSVQAIAEAYKQMSPTDAEKKRMAEIQQKLQKAIQDEMKDVVLGAFLGVDSLEQAKSSTADMMQAGDAQGPYVRQSWEMNKTVLLRGLDARDTADRELKKITDSLERRSGKTLPESDFAWSMLVSGSSISLSAQLGRQPLKSPLVQLLLYRKSTGGQWTAANGMSSGLGLGMGIMNGADAAEGMKLSVAQERAMNLPYATTFLLPDLNADSRTVVNLNLPLMATLGVERAELYVWTDQGKLHLDQVSGLDTVQRRAEQLLEKERAERQGQPGLLRQMFQPPAAQAQADPRDLSKDQQKALAQQKAVQENYANQSLKRAKNAIARKDDRMAEYYLKDTISKAPDSTSARTAKRLLKKYEK